MTVISFKQNSFNNKAKRTVSKRRNSSTRSISINRGTIILNIMLLGLIISLISIYCISIARTTSWRLDVRSLEKKILTLEEKNAELKMSSSQNQKSGELENSIYNNFIYEEWPEYFSLSSENNNPINDQLGLLER